MSEMIENNVWLTDRADGRRFALALAAGLALELGALALALPILTHQHPPSDQQSQVVKLSIIAPAPAPPTPPPKLPPPPKPVITPPPLPPPPPLPVAPQIPLPPIPMAPAHFAHHLEHIRHVPPPPPVNPPVPQAPPAPAPPAPSVIPQPSAGEIDLFQAEMAQAVQRAANADYPAAAQMARENGEVALDFTFIDGAVQNIVIERSSGFPLLDEAAVQAVRDAAYPPEPPDFAGRPHNVRVVVEFHTAAVETDGD